MNIQIWKKHLVGKAIAFSTLGTIDAKYRGVISDVVEKPEWNGSIVICVKDGNFHAVRAFFMVDSIMHSVEVTEGQRSQPAVEEPVIDGCIPLGQLVRQVIFREEEELKNPTPPSPPSVKKLIRETGTFTGCQELTDRFVKNGLIRKEGRILYVSLDISDESGCMCGLATDVEQIESVTRDIKKFFDADEIVYQHTHRRADNLAVVEVEPGYKGEIRKLPGAYKGDSWCGTYPVIKGLGMRWEPVPQEQ